MDRDKRWERTQRHMSDDESIGSKATDPIAAISASYAEGVTEEFVQTDRRCGSK